MTVEDPVLKHLKKHVFEALNLFRPVKVLKESIHLEHEKGGAGGAQAIDGQPVSNRDALMNPEVLDYYASIEEMRKD